MYANTDSLELGEDHFYIKDGKYAFTYVYDGDSRIDVDSVPETVTKSYGKSEYINEVHAYVKETGELLDEDDVSELCYQEVIVPKSRLEVLDKAKREIQDIIDKCSLTEPFVYEGGELRVGKEHVLSAHIQAGYDQGWISSSICW